MILVNLYSELQLNPRSKDVYRKIKEEYDRLGMKNESEAFEMLIKKKFHDNSTDIDEKQSKNDSSNA